MIFWNNLPKKGISSLKQIKSKPTLNSSYSNWCRHQISAYTDNFDFLEQIHPKRVFPVENRKSKHDH